MPQRHQYGNAPKISGAHQRRLQTVRQIGAEQRLVDQPTEEPDQRNHLNTTLADASFA